MAGAGEQPPVLAPRYYLHNFERLLETVRHQYGDLLTLDEDALLARFLDCGDDARCLYVRMVSRVGPWFHPARFQYPELGSIDAALAELAAAGLLARSDAMPVAGLQPLYTREELARHFGAPAPSQGKPAQIAALLETHGDAAVPLPAPVVAPLGLEVVALLQLLFFGNRRQGLTDFVLSDLGVANYYPYQLDRSRRRFPDREAIDEYLELGALADAWHLAREAGDPGELAALAQVISQWQPRRQTSQRRWHRLCNGVARECERLGEDALAVALYQRSELHPARERRARVLERSGDPAGALALCEAILAEPWGEEERDAAERIRPRLLRQLQGRTARRRRDQFDTLTLRLPPGDERVELAAARALASQWPQVHYVENTLFNGLFGLVFWAQIFEPLPGAFDNPFQAAPADMFEQGFMARRRETLAARLAALAEADLSAEIASAWREYAGYQSRWVNWRYLDEALLLDAVRVIPRTHLLAIWQRMLFDPGENRRGFPDLLALGETPGQYCLIEVKAPGDALQESQKRWLRFFARETIPAQVAWVEWCDD